MHRAAKAPWRIGVDVGGTFTDLVLIDSRGQIWPFKAPSNPADPSSGVIDAISAAASALGTEIGPFLEQCVLFVHGSTIATNTLLERSGAKVGLLTTDGFRDSLEIRRGIRDEVWDHRSPMPEVLVPRKLRRPIVERIDKTGRPIKKVDPGSVAAAVDLLRREKVESIAICLINSFLNDEHERQCRDIVRSLWPEVWISCSSDVVPIIGEYERSSTTVVNAYLARRVVPYLRSLDSRLQELGLPHRLLLVQSNGGAVSVDQVETRPCALALSGPAAGLGALQHFSGSVANDNLLTMEIGGTSCDVTLMHNGKVAMVDQISVAGYHICLPSVEIHTVSAGGGTIASVDHGGMLHVGPRGAGARPGPACYGFGGRKPTVTDAQLVLGRLKSGRYANGIIELDSTLAREAIEREVAEPLGVDITTAAAGMIRLMEQEVLHAVERVSIERGYDPQRFTLIAGGGAGAMHACSVGRALGCRDVYVPRLAGVFCAFGMCNTDVRHDYVKTWLGNLDDMLGGQMEDAFSALETVGGVALMDEGFTADQIDCRRGLDLKYGGQQWPISVAFDDFDLLKIRRTFETEHERLFGHQQPDGFIEMANLRVGVVGDLPRMGLAPESPCDTEPKHSEMREVYVSDGHGQLIIPVYDGADLKAGHRIAGPCLVEELTTTILVEPDATIKVDHFSNYIIKLL